MTSASRVDLRRERERAFACLDAVFTHHAALP